MLKKLFYYISALLILISSQGVAGSGPKKCKCDEDAVANRVTTDESWNKNIMEGCAAIQNKEYQKAYDALEKALKAGEDAYIQGLFKCLKEMKDAGGFSDQGSPAVLPRASSTAKAEPLKATPAPEPVKETAVAKEAPKAPPATAKETPAPVTTPPAPAPPAEIRAEDPKPKEEARVFSASELATFQEKGILKVQTLKNYLNKISNKSTSMSDGMDAIRNALKLFYGETYVQVSSTGSSNKPNFPTKTYLERVRALNYDNVDIEWADFEYTSNLKKAPDGNYYGYIKFRQRFKGMKDGRVVYEDVTDKIVAVILKAYDKNIEGEKVENFDVFLGDIEVLQTIKN